MKSPVATPTDAKEPPKTSIESLPTTVLHHIFGFLGPQDLVLTSVTCRAWAALLGDAASNEHWRHLFLLRWASPAAAEPASAGNDPERAPGPLCSQRQKARRGCSQSSSRSGTWRNAYSTKLARLQHWDGKTQSDHLNGHRAAVRAIKLCPSLNLAATASTDRTVKLWDLSAGSLLASSLLHQGMVRSVAFDSRLLVSGGSDATIRCWRAWPGEGGGSGRSPFVLTAEQPAKLAGKDAHTGPVTCLELTSQHLYSSSWDMSVRCWRRPDNGCADPAQLESAHVWGYSDFVWSVALRGPRLLVGAGRDLFVQDAATGQLITTVDEVFGPSAAAVEGTYSGQFAFTGGGNGQLLMHDLRMPSRRTGCALLWQSACDTTITSLSLEDPWLAMGATDGVACLLDLSDAMRMASRAADLGRLRLGPTMRRRVISGGMQPVHCIAIQDSWVGCANDSPVARTWKCAEQGGATSRFPRSRGGQRLGRRSKKSGPAVPDPLEGHSTQRQMGAASAASGAPMVVPAAPGKGKRAPQPPLPVPAAPVEREADIFPASRRPDPDQRMETWAIVRPKRQTGGAQAGDPASY